MGYDVRKPRNEGLQPSPPHHFEPTSAEANPWVGRNKRSTRRYHNLAECTLDSGTEVLTFH